MSGAFDITMIILSGKFVAFCGTSRAHSIYSAGSSCTPRGLSVTINDRPSRPNVPVLKPGGDRRTRLSQRGYRTKDRFPVTGSGCDPEAWADRKRGVEGKSGSIRVDDGGCR